MALAAGAFRRSHQSATKTPRYRPNAVAGAPMTTAPPAATIPRRLSAEYLVSGIWNARSSSDATIVAATASGREIHRGSRASATSSSTVPRLATNLAYSDRNRFIQPPREATRRITELRGMGSDGVERAAERGHEVGRGVHRFACRLHDGASNSDAVGEAADRRGLLGRRNAEPHTDR